MLGRLGLSATANRSPWRHRGVFVGFGLHRPARAGQSLSLAKTALAVLAILVAGGKTLVLGADSATGEAEATSTKAETGRQLPPEDAKTKGVPVRGPAFAANAGLDGIMAIKDERGRTLYVNDSRSRLDAAAGAAPGTRANSSASLPSRSRRLSVLVYWSNHEQQWKPVPPPTSLAMRAAHTAAVEVERYGAEASPSYLPPQRGREISSQEINSAIEQAAARHHVDANLVRAIIKVESNFNPRAISPKGAMGLMQLMPETARRLSVNHPFDPQENVDAGVRHLRNLLDNYGGDLKLSLAAYNAGETAVARSNGVPNIAETRNYVKQITGSYEGATGRVETAIGAGRHGGAPVRAFRRADGVWTFTNE